MHSSELVWIDRYNPYPFKKDRSTEILKREEIDRFSEIFWDFKCRTFDLTNPSDYEDYIKVMDRIVNGWFVLWHRKYIENDKGEIVKVYLEWAQAYCDILPEFKIMISG
ncbi:MAG: hypothetical protein QXT77_04295 [Candidatus Methanomethylicaceae archaeon]